MWMPAKTLAKIKKLFGDMPSHPLPAQDGGQPAAGEAGDVHARQQPALRAGFCGLSSAGNGVTGLRGRADSERCAGQPARRPLRDGAGRARRWLPSLRWRRPIPKASVGFGVVALPAGPDPSAGDRGDERKILASYARERRARRSGRGGQTQRDSRRRSFSATLFPGLANVWSTALAAEGRNSPEEDLEAIRKVTLADVNRVAKQYLLNANTITATLKPVPSGAAGRREGLWRGRAVHRRADQAGRAASMGRRRRSIS